MTARNVVWADAGAATATRLPTHAAARIAFLNAFIPSPPLSSRRPNAYCSGPCPVSDRTIGSIFSFTTPFDPTTLVAPGAQAEIRTALRTGPFAAGLRLPPDGLQSRFSSANAPPQKSTIKNDARITVAPTSHWEGPNARCFPFTNSPPIPLVKGPHRTQNIPAQPGGPIMNPANLPFDSET